MIITRTDCFELAKLVDASSEFTKYDIKTFENFYAIIIAGVEIVSISKDLYKVQIKPKANLTNQQKDIILKTVDWIKFMQNYDEH
jgi:hypothetical protein